MCRQIRSLLTCLFLTSLLPIPTYPSEEDVAGLKSELDAVRAALNAKSDFTEEELDGFFANLSPLGLRFTEMEKAVTRALPFLNNENGNPRIAVIGGGYTGVLSSILLAGLKRLDGSQALEIHLFEKNLNLLNGASTAPARLHLGGEYPKDPTTALQCLISALIFR